MILQTKRKYDSNRLAVIKSVARQFLYRKLYAFALIKSEFFLKSFCKCLNLQFVTESREPIAVTFCAQLFIDLIDIWVNSLFFWANSLHFDWF